MTAKNQLAFYFDRRHCSGCGACEIACRDSGGLPGTVSRRRVTAHVSGGFITTGGTVVPQVRAYFDSSACRHCLEPACSAVCRVGALEKDPQTGIVRLDDAKCVGCGACMTACPYGAVEKHPDTGKACKCDFCEALIAEGKDPVCVAACPLRVLYWGALETLRRERLPQPGTQDCSVSEPCGPALLVTRHPHEEEPPDA